MADLPVSLDSPHCGLNDEFLTPEYLEARRRAIEQTPGPEGMDSRDPKGPSGHAYAIRVSTRLTSGYRRTYRKGAVDVTPQEVIDVLNAAGVKQWVLIGLHGYVGYMPDPRATKDVDVIEKKDYDAGDFRRLVKANYERISREDLRRLAGLIWEGAPNEIEQFVESAKKGEPFTI